jgi:tRNA threonylcarbamoyl adenosine modification protein YeaZ
MKILALEFSSHERSIAVLADGEVRGFAMDQSPRAFAHVQEALRQAGFSTEQIECIAVGRGPGSYAGTRVAMAIAQGWQLARGVKLLGISSADAIARRINTAEGLGIIGRTAPFVGVANILFDAQRGELYATRYQFGEHDPRVLGGFVLLTTAEEKLRREAGEIFIKADTSPWPGSDVILPPSARDIGHLAISRTDFIAGSQLEPVYLRPVEFVKAPIPKGPGV